MRILVFGASGWVGSRLADRLSRDHELIGVVRTPPGGSAPAGVPSSTGTGFTPLVCPDWVADPESVLERLSNLAADRRGGAAVAAGAGTGGADAAAGAGKGGSTSTAPGNPAGIDAVLAAVGGWYVGAPMLERGVSAFDADYESYLRAHMSACTIASALGADVHLALNGVASIEACVGSGAISVFGAAQQMLIRVADAESSHTRFRELTILAPLAGDRRNDLTGGVETIGIDRVAEAAETILAGGADEVITHLAPPE